MDMSISDRRKVDKTLAPIPMSQHVSTARNEKVARAAAAPLLMTHSLGTQPCPPVADHELEQIPTGDESPQGDEDEVVQSEESSVEVLEGVQGNKPSTDVAHACNNIFTLVVLRGAFRQMEAIQKQMTRRIEEERRQDKELRREEEKQSTRKSDERRRDERIQHERASEVLHQELLHQPKKQPL